VHLFWLLELIHILEKNFSPVHICWPSAEALKSICLCTLDSAQCCKVDSNPYKYPKKHKHNACTEAKAQPTPEIHFTPSAQNQTHTILDGT